MPRAERDAAQTEAAFAVERMGEMVLALDEPELLHRWQALLGAWERMLETQDSFFAERVREAMEAKKPSPASH